MERLIGRIDKIKRNAQGEIYGTVMSESGEFFAFHGGALDKLASGDIVNFVAGVANEGHEHREALDMAALTRDWPTVEQFMKFCKFVRERVG